MRQTMFGATIGAIAMYFYLQGFGPIVGMAQGWWVRISAPHANALQQ